MDSRQADTLCKYSVNGERCPLGNRCPCGGMAPRERQVFHRLLTPDCEKEAARALGISPHTLHVYAKQIYRRFDVSGRVELLVKAMRALAADTGAVGRAPSRSVRRKKHAVVLTSDQRGRLQALVESSERQQTRKLVRARVLLLVTDGMADADAARSAGVSVRAVERIRRRFAEAGFELALEGRGQPPRPHRRALDADAEALLLALSSEPPPGGRRRWTAGLLAQRLVALRRVESISPRTITRVLRRHAAQPNGTSIVAAHSVEMSSLGVGRFDCRAAPFMTTTELSLAWVQVPDGPAIWQ